MIDWHSHILPGIDDGPPDMELSLMMAAALATYGFTTVYCTPHLIRGCYEAGNDLVRQRVAELQGLLTEAGSALEVLPGREYYLDEYLPAFLEEPLPLGDSRQILIEIPPHATSDMTRQMLYNIVRSGFSPVIAHPERCHLLEPVRKPSRDGGLLGSLKGLMGLGRTPVNPHAAPDSSGNPLLDYLRDLGCSFQGNLGSFRGYYGARTRSVAEELRDLGVFDRYGSDLHAPDQARHILGAEPTA